MKKGKKLLSILLMMTMALSLGVIGFSQEAAAEEAAAGSDINAQLNLIYSRLNELKQDETQMKWYYSVTDLDHDGRLEFVAAAQHPADRSTNLKIWEVTEDRSGLAEYTLNKDPEESFPDIMTDSADTYHDTATDTWHYLCYDNVVISPTEVYTIKSGVHIKDGVVGYDAYALEHTQIVNGVRNVTHTDNNGITISAEQYNAAGANAFAGAERSSTSFDWFTAENAGALARLTDSYMVFAGMKEATEVFPVPKPEALQQLATPTPAATQAPAVTPVPAPVPTPVPTSAPAPAFLMITKNPTNENNRKVGGTANFVACANVFDSLSWTFVSPDGGEYSVPTFCNMFGAQVSGEYSTTLSVSNVASGMSGWGAYCTFYYQGQSARTTTAYMYVNGAPDPVVPTPPQSGSFEGYVTDYGYNTVTLYIYDGGGYTKEVGRDICSVSGDLYVGAPCVAYYDGIGAHGAIFTFVSIQGQTPQVGPVYGSMSGTAYHDTAFTIYVVLQDGSSYHLDGNLVNMYGTLPEYGAGCTVYYTNYPSEANIYQVDVYGEEDVYVEPDYYEPDTVVVYDNDEEFDGGWAGSNYYDDGPSYYDDPLYDPVGDEHNRVTCPVCGNHFSVGADSCPVCGWTP